MKMTTSGKHGFTLVEIMIVVAIISLLASIAVPSYHKSREGAYKATCINNLRQIDGAIHLWSLELKKDEQQPVVYSDIRSYLKGLVVCPSGGKSFEDSYIITTVDTQPTCQRKPAIHQMTPN
jgi:prepilin-type N-terminal cleavage/methylation domain-containing protein